MGIIGVTPLDLSKFILNSSKCCSLASYVNFKTLIIKRATSTLTKMHRQDNYPTYLLDG